MQMLYFFMRLTWNVVCSFSDSSIVPMIMYVVPGKEEDRMCKERAPAFSPLLLPNVHNFLFIV